MDLPRTPDDLHGAITQPGDPFDDMLLKHGADLTEAELRSLLGSKPHVDPVHPNHEAVVDRILRANETDARPQSPASLTDGDGGDHSETMKRFASDTAAAASQVGVEPAVKVLQAALNEQAADWSADDPHRPGPIMPDGLYGPKTHAALRRHVALGRYSDIKQAVDRKRAELLRPAQGVFGASTGAAMGTAGAPVGGPSPLTPPKLPDFSKLFGFDWIEEQRRRREYAKPLVTPILPGDFVPPTNYPMPQDWKDLVLVNIPELIGREILVYEKRGRRGNDDTQDDLAGHNGFIGQRAALRAHPPKHKDGGRDEDGKPQSEEYYPPLDENGDPTRARSGGSYSDSTWVDPTTGNTLDLAHHDILKDGSPTSREMKGGVRLARNAANCGWVLFVPKSHRGFRVDLDAFGALLDFLFDDMAKPCEKGRPYLERTHRLDEWQKQSQGPNP